MPYRTKTYIAGDWEYDQNAINQLYKWKNSYYWSFDFIDAHEFKQARDSSLNCSIKRSLKERLNRSKTFVLVVGEHTKTVTAGSCHYCRSYNSYLKYCSRNSSLEYRSFIQYEYYYFYNSNYIYKSWCPDILKNEGYHVSMMKNNVWNYTEIKHLFDILS